MPFHRSNRRSPPCSSVWRRSEALRPHRCDGFRHGSDPVHGDGAAVGRRPRGVCAGLCLAQPAAFRQPSCRASVLKRFVLPPRIWMPIAAR